MGKGFSKKAVAGCLGISREGLYRWCRRYPEFRDTIKRGEMRSLLFWERMGLLGTVGKLKDFNESVWMFTMKTRFHSAYKMERELDTYFQ